MYTDKGVDRFITAIYRRAAKDYKRAMRYRNKFEAKQIKDFLTSGAYGIKREIGEEICKNVESGFDIVGGE